MPQSELNRAKAALQFALDAWQNGAQSDGVEGADVFDADWMGGLRLLNYMIYHTESRDGEGIRCGVALALLDRQGKKRTRDVVYSVHGGEKIVIAREPTK